MNWCGDDDEDGEKAFKAAQRRSDLYGFVETLLAEQLKKDVALPIAVNQARRYGLELLEFLDKEASLE